MSSASRCERCGADLAAFVTEGFCPACLLEQGLGGAASHPAPASRGPALGLFGEYELLEEIARGGMGVVYKARQSRLDRLVALKMILTGHLASPTEVQRFLAEARTVASLQHPNIVAIHEVGEHDGQPFFSMDYVAGQNLAQLVRENPLTAVRAARYVRIIAEAVHYAHEHGVLHRDLKPSNVLVDPADQPRVTDFGLAKRVESGGELRVESGETPRTGSSQLSTQDPLNSLTLSGQVLGSPNFMPPEQAAGTRGEVGPASDVYSLGAILYHLLTGRPPFLADSMTVTLRLVAETEPTSPRLLVPTIPRDLETICLKCLEKEPARRYASAQELAEDLGRFLRDEPIQARPANRVDKLTRWCRRHPALAAVSALAFLLVIAVVTVSTTAAVRLRAANIEAREKLRDSYLAQARANRWSGRVGRRFDSLEALQKAADIRPSIELRNEAIAAMALVDVRSVKQWPVDMAHSCHQVFDAPFERYVRTQTNGTITLHRASDDQELMHWAGAGDPISLTAFSPSGRFLASSVSSDLGARFQVRDLFEGGATVFQDSNRWVRTFRFSADSRKLAIVWWANRASSVSIYQTADWREVTSFPTRFLPRGIDFNPSGDRLVVSSTEDRDVQVHHAHSGELLLSLPHASGVYCVDWGPGGDLIATGCADRHVYLWDVSQSPPRQTRLSVDAVAPHLSFNHRGDLLATGDWHDWGKLWEVATGKELLRWSAANGAPAFSLDDRHIAVAADRTELFQLSSAEECRTLHFNPSPGGGSYSVAYSPDGGFLVSTHKDGLRLWDRTSCRASLFLPHGDTRFVQFARDGRGFFTAQAAGLYWWPITAKEEQGTNRITLGAPEQVGRQSPGTVDPANRLVLPASGKAYVIDGQSRRVERRLATAGNVYAAALSADGRQVATYSLGSAVVEVWDADDGRRLAAVGPPPGSCVLFSPDGRWLVTGAEEYVFWERSSWTRRHSLPRGVTGGTHGRIDFSPDGRILALSVGRGQVELFEAATFGPLATFETPELEAVSDIAFSPDGTQMAVCTQGQEIRLWNLVPIRRQLAAMKLDYDLPPMASATNVGKPVAFAVAALPAPAPPVVFVPGALDFPARDPLCRSNHIDLTRFYNATLTNSWFNPRWKQNDLAALPRGLQTLDGVSFDVRGVLQLSCTHPDLAGSYPVEAKAIPVHQRCRVLHFLHAAGWSAPAGTDIGEYAIRYDDGSERVVSLTYAENIGSWWATPDSAPLQKPGTTAAWRGRNPMTERASTGLNLFHFRWQNPRPEVAVANISFRSRMTDAAPFLIAITAE